VEDTYGSFGKEYGRVADLRFVLPGPDMITLSGQTADKLIRAGDGDAVLLYLFVLRTGGALSGREAAGALNCTVGDIKRSMELLGRLGLLKCGETPPAPQKDELPEYTAEDIRRELDNGTVFSSLVQEAQKSLGKLLSSDDLVKLFGIYDSLGLPPEVILHLITYCIDENRRRYGPSRVPTMRYIEKTAYTWEREGIFTLEQAEQYLKLLESRKTQIADIKRVLQIRDRELTSGELKYLEGWLSAGFTPEIVEIAYDRTVMRTGKLSWSYMDRILGDWRQKGFRSAEEILQKDTKAAPHAAQQKKPPKSPEADLADIERMKKYLQKLREE
jgi:DnaD/phage-associated family protein